jgi:hypothetical protein
LRPRSPQSHRLARSDCRQPKLRSAMPPCNQTPPEAPLPGGTATNKHELGLFVKDKRETYADVIPGPRAARSPEPITTVLGETAGVGRGDPSQRRLWIRARPSGPPRNDSAILIVRSREPRALPVAWRPAAVLRSVQHVPPIGQPPPVAPAAGRSRALTRIRSSPTPGPSSCIAPLHELPPRDVAGPGRDAAARRPARRLTSSRPSTTTAGTRGAGAAARLWSSSPTRRPTTISGRLPTRSRGCPERLARSWRRLAGLLPSRANVVLVSTWASWSASVRYRLDRTPAGAP